MSDRVDLVWLGGSSPVPRWSLGEVFPTEPTPAAVAGRIAENLKGSRAEAWLFWDSALGSPTPGVVGKVLRRPGDLWHAGLQLGMGGLPRALDFVAPAWMLHRDPDPEREATSWRLSLRCSLIKKEVLDRVGSLRPEFRTLEGAALELGHRFVRRGVLTRQVPGLLDEAPRQARGSDLPALPLEDEFRFVFYRFGRKWTRWFLGRALLTGYAEPVSAIRTWRRVMQETKPPDPPPFRPLALSPPGPLGAARVSVLVPTLDRYTYLRTLLGQFRAQTVRPLEIIVVDQTPVERREPRLFSAFSDLPLRVISLDFAGQCSSRNAGLKAVQGDFVLFVDDDDEIPPDLIARHLQSLEQYRADVSSGVAQETGAGPLPPDFTLVRASDVFPTNNTLVRREVLRRSGLFDLAYDHGPRADHDLGMRLYLSGHLMVLNPAISVVHHHAPRGGLRTHGARVITYASSRSRILHRQLPAATEVYLAKKYFSPAQAREMLWLAVLGTFSIRGGLLRKGLKAAVSLLRLPGTLWRIRRTIRSAAALERGTPSTPTLAEPLPAVVEMSRK